MPPVLELQSWTQCDACTKWRRVPAEYAETLNDDEPWYCANNPDAAHNSCDVPQELSDAEIDLLHATDEKGKAAGGGGGSAGAGDEPADGATKRHHKRPPVWQLITANSYTHRERKEQDEDDIMICQCKKIWATDTTSVGCGPECLNRMLNIECVEEYCPSGHRCSNQMFTRKEYSRLEVKRAGLKGFGLFAGQDMKAGQFVIEYLGEVLEEEEYHRRKEYFIETGQRHYYFMNVGNGEVIDASRRGNLGRFINHSCEPNCETQKWVVHGELAIGLFTLEDIPAGTELTFDYNFERYGDKPMKCLCGSKNCRGVIGGTQDKEGGAARAAVLEAAVEIPDEDPDFIMVNENEKDAALAAILDRVVGLGWEKGWTPKLSDRLHKLASKHGVDLANLSEEEEEEGLGGSSGASEDEAAAAAAAAAKQRAAGRKPAAKPRARGRKQQQQQAARARQRKAAAEAEWDVEELSEASSASDSEAAPGSDGDEAPGRASRSRGAEAARAAAALAGSELPFRRRLKRFARAAAAAEAAADSPADSWGSQPAQPRRPAPRATQSAASSAPGAATPSAAPPPLIPKRSGAATPAERPAQPKRRSEIDRRLDEVVNASGRLRESHPDVIIRVLRLFNLCEIGPTVGKMDEDGDSQLGGGGGGRAGGPQRSDSSAPAPAPNGSAAEPRGARPPSRSASGASLQPRAAAGTPSSAAPLGLEEGEVAPEPGRAASAQQSALQPPERERPQHDWLQPPRHGSPGKDRRAEVASRVRAAWAEAQRSGQLSARQSARIADTSLLLDVVLKTNTLSARKDFVKCGILRQLLGVVGGNTGKQYGVILKKVLRVVESLPLTSDDMHHTRSAHGSFADLLRELAQSTDFEIRSKAYGLLKRFPVQSCTRPLVPEAPMHSSAGSSRGPPRPPPPGMLTPSGGPGPGPPWRDGPPPPPPALAQPGGPGGPPFGGPPPPGHGPPPPGHGPLPPDGFRPREMPPSRFGPGRGPPPGGPGWLGPGPPMLRPPSLPPQQHRPPFHHHGPPPPHHFPPPPHGPPGRPPPPPLPPGGTPNGASPWPPPSDAPSSRKRSRWDEPQGGPPSPPRALPPGFGDGPPPPPLPGEPAAKRTANGVDSDALAAAPSWDIETQFAVGTLGGSAAFSPGGGTLSPDGRPSGAPLTYSPPAGGAASFSPDAGRRPASAGGPAGGAMHLSPMSDDEAAAAPAPAAAPPPPEPAQLGEAWDAPDAAFAAFVADMVRRRVGKYAQPDHPMRITQDEAGSLYSKIRREIVAKEQAAYEQRQAAGAFKPIERDKLEGKIRDYVRDSVRRHHERRGGY